MNTPEELLEAFGDENSAAWPLVLEMLYERSINQGDTSACRWKPTKRPIPSR